MSSLKPLQLFSVSLRSIAAIATFTIWILCVHNIHMVIHDFLEFCILQHIFKGLFFHIFLKIYIYRFFSSILSYFDTCIYTSDKVSQILALF